MNAVTETGTDTAIVYHSQNGGKARPQLTRFPTTWAAFVEAMSYEHDEREDKDGPGLIMADFSAPYRRAENVTHYSALCLDMDTHAGPTGRPETPPSPAFAAEQLRRTGLAGLVYTTHNHETPAEINSGKPAGPRYRVIIPLARQIAPQDLERVTMAAARLLWLDGPGLDSKSWVVGQFFYMPSCRPGAPRVALVVRGEPLDPDTVVVEQDLAAEEPEPDPEQARTEPVAWAPRLPGVGLFDETKSRARGQWRGILSSLGIAVSDRPRMHSACPGCGGKDRFRFDDRDGEGTWICSQGGAGTTAGDGFDLVQHARHVDAAGALRMVRDALGMARPERQQQRHAPRDHRPEPVPALPAAAPAANDNTPVARAYDPLAIDWYSPFPDVNGKGKPLATIENLADACRRLGVVVRYNVISKDVEILAPGQSFSVDNRANGALAWLTSACVRFGVPVDKIGEYLVYLADGNLYNPVAQWITSRRWDGTQRLQPLLDTIEADGQSDPSVRRLKEAMLRRWMISAVAAAFSPDGISAHGVLVLQGDQYLGKTKWFKSLVPAHLGVIQDGLMLRPDDRDSVKQAVSYWLVELGELDATFRKSDIAQLKAFITRDKDELRRAYAKHESKYARRTVFFASVNPRQFLHDPTGNRRYWTISCTKIDSDHGLDMQQVWAEVYETLHLAGEGWYLTADEMAALNDHNKDHEVLDPIRERLLTRLAWDEPGSLWRWMTATDVMLEIGFDRPSRADVTQCGQILQELNGKQRRKSNGRPLTRVPPAAPRL